jgi:hypothetical protein
VGGSGQVSLYHNSIFNLCAVKVTGQFPASFNLVEVIKPENARG